jgi:small subunit ribosomal protein S1
MQALLDQGGYDMPQRGDIREGTVISVSPQEVIIDLGLKREAVVPASDLSRLDKEMLAEIQEGTTWPVYILQPSDREGNLLVSLSRALQEKDWLVAQQAMENNEMIEAKVSSYNAGGLEVIFGDLRGFVPASHLSSLPRELSPEERKARLAGYVGQTIPVKVVEVDRKRRRLIMSERAARRRWQREHRKQLLDDIQIGEVRTGIVRSLAEFGAFIDLGGADGLVHISELAWFPVGHPSEVLKVGQQVEVKVLRIDKPRERVGLSLKRVQPDPWSNIDGLYNVNDLVEAVVTRVTDFGAFVRLRSGVEGLLHVSEMADIRPDHPQSLVNPGDLLLLRVLRIEPDRRRIGLSLRAVSETEWAEWAASYREKQAANVVEEEPQVSVSEQTTEVVTPEAVEVIETRVEEIVTPEAVEVIEARVEEIVTPEAVEVVETRVEEIVTPEAVEVVETRVDEIVTPEAVEVVAAEVDEIVSPEAVEVVAAEVEEIDSPEAAEVVAAEVEEIVSPEAVEVVAAEVEEIVSPEAAEVVAAEVTEVVKPVSDEVLA